ncbi:hypothetical protein CEM_143 [Candidatus Johnevansia muelleri]|uniref:Uncharacterized protein n=1 Tax=Candidatus Johnevansia muelleri TaxID=1495769 RepID=A0A078KB60_9GAMM|nr:hypothetical protein CEM_143 [Candidatus Evansia muelleri]
MIFDMLFNNLKIDLFANHLPPDIITRAEVSSWQYNLI